MKHPQYTTPPHRITAVSYKFLAPGLGPTYGFRSDMYDGARRSDPASLVRPKPRKCTPFRTQKRSTSPIREWLSRGRIGVRGVCGAYKVRRGRRDEAIGEGFNIMGGSSLPLLSCSMIGTQIRRGILYKNPVDARFRLINNTRNCLLHPQRTVVAPHFRNNYSSISKYHHISLLIPKPSTSFHHTTLPSPS